MTNPTNEAMEALADLIKLAKQAHGHDPIALHDIVSDRSDTIRSALMSKPVAGWMQIETFVPEYDDEGDSQSVLTYPHYRVAHMVKEIGVFGRYDTNMEQSISFYPQPTHWQPLPAPPHTEERG